MINNYEELNDMHLDVLREIGNIGSGNAATSLSSMMSKVVDINIPSVRIVDFDTAISCLGGAETLTVGVLVNFHGDVSGMMMFLSNIPNAKLIINTLLGQETDQDNDEIIYDEMGNSVIQEIGNILASAYVNSISSLTGLTIDISIPYVAIDMAGSLLSVPIIEFGEVGDRVMFIDGGFAIAENEQNNLHSNIIFFLEMDSLKTVMDRLGIEY